jgi:hypothetical protein
MANLFDPKNPRTWPENFKRRPTEAFTNVGVEGRDLAKSMVNNRFSSNAQTPVYNAGGDFNLRGMQTPYENYDLKPSNLIKAGITAMGPGVTKDVINGTYLFGKTVVHGSPQQGLKEIKPQIGSARFPEDSIAYGWNPRFNQDTAADWMTDAGKQYMGDSRTGSLYAGKIPRNAILEDPDPNLGELMVLGGKPIRVTKEFPQMPVPEGVNTLTWNATQDKAMKEALAEYLRRRGLGPVPKNPLPPVMKKFKDFLNPPPPPKPPVA